MKWLPRLLLFLFAALATAPVLAQPPHVQRMHRERDLQKAEDRDDRERRKADHARYRAARKADHQAHKARRKSGAPAAARDRYRTRTAYPTRRRPGTTPRQGDARNPYGRTLPKFGGWEARGSAN